MDWAEHVFEQGMLYVRVRFTDKTELCWVLQTAHVILEADLGDWKTGDFKQLAIFVRNESDLGYPWLEFCASTRARLRGFSERESHSCD